MALDISGKAIYDEVWQEIWARANDRAKLKFNALVESIEKSGTNLEVWERYNLLGVAERLVREEDARAKETND